MIVVELEVRQLSEDLWKVKGGRGCVATVRRSHTQDRPFVASVGDEVERFWNRGEAFEWLRERV